MTDHFLLSGSGNVERLPDELNVALEDHEGDFFDISEYWRQHDYYHTGEWFLLQTYSTVGNGMYHSIPKEGTNWIWGNMTYTWSVNMTDPLGLGLWTNRTYNYSTRGSR